ncbi:MAG: ABC transporter substrate-binding protein [Chromatiales bacterium]|jgi:phospholipid transport system substrate-binding protein
MKVKVIGISALLLGVAAAAPAQAYYPGGPQYRAQPTEEAPTPKAIVVRGFGKLIAFLRSDRPRTPKTVAMFLETEIAPYFDFEHMAQWAAGPRYRAMSPKQRAAMEQELKEDFLTTLTERLAGYSDQQVRFLPTRSRSADQQTVSVAIQNPSGYPARIDFKFYRSDEGWKVFDVAANGSSAIVYYRQMFNRSWRQTPRPAVPYGPRG